MNEREQQYRRKINFIVEKVHSFPTKFSSSESTDAYLYRAQIAIEAAMDMIAMLVKDKGKTVSDDYHNIDTLLSLKVVTPEAALQLKHLNGLRNAIVHKYNKFEEETAVKQRENIQKNLLAFLKTVEHELKTILARTATPATKP